MARPARYVAYQLLDVATADWCELGRFTSRRAAERAARLALSGRAIQADAPCFAAAESGGYWHPDETAIAAFASSDDTDDVTWIAAA